MGPVVLVHIELEDSPGGQWAGVSGPQGSPGLGSRALISLRWKYIWTEICEGLGLCLHFLVLFYFERTFIPWPFEKQNRNIQSCIFLFQIDALREVVAAVKGKIEVYMDGGVRTGNGVLKALALGARCIFLGRPILWGLACKVRLLAWDVELRTHSCDFPLSIF